MIRRQFRDQVRIVAEGGDPVGVSFDEADALRSVIAGNYIIGADTDLDAVPLSDSLR
jgi:hypothetical protein